MDSGDSAYAGGSSMKESIMQDSEQQDTIPDAKEKQPSKFQRAPRDPNRRPKSANGNHKY